jgi:hypothetical protein
MATLAHDFPAAVTRRSWSRSTGIVLSGIAILFFVLDAGGKLIAPEVMIANSPPLGLPEDTGLYRLIGVILAFCTALYVWPRTALGAVLLTGFLGGAIAMNLRAEMPLFANTLFGVYVGALMWAGLFLRRPQIFMMMGLAWTNKG